MSKRTWLILGIGLLLIAVAFFVFKWENKPEPDPEPDPVKKPAAKTPTVTPEQPIKDLTAQQTNAGDDEQLS